MSLELFALGWGEPLHKIFVAVLINLVLAQLHDGRGRGLGSAGAVLGPKCRLEHPWLLAPAVPTAASCPSLGHGLPSADVFRFHLKNVFLMCEYSLSLMPFLIFMFSH